MQTRSKLNLTNINHIEFYSKLPNPQDIILNKINIHNLPYYLLLPLQYNHQRNHQHNHQYKHNTIFNKDTAYNIRSVLIFDTESFKVRNDYWIPYQIAWGIYKWDSDSRKLSIVDSSMFYINNTINNPIYQKYLPEKILTQTNKRVFTSIDNVLSKLDNDITNFNIDTISAYNINYDFKIIQELLETSRVHDKRDVLYKNFSGEKHFINPFRNQNIKYLDLMHTMLRFYIHDLIKLGLKDGSVWNCIETNRLRVTKTPRSSGIYSLEYILNNLFSIHQTHHANDDVEHEALLLEKILKDHGDHSLEYNVCYIDSAMTHVNRVINKSDYKKEVPWESKQMPKHHDFHN